MGVWFLLDSEITESNTNLLLFYLKEILLAEKWARLNKLPFPPIDVTVFDREGMKELYIFKHPTDPHCPVVLHFVLVNIDFREFTKPGKITISNHIYFLYSDILNFILFKCCIKIFPILPYIKTNLKTKNIWNR